MRPVLAFAAAVAEAEVDPLTGRWRNPNAYPGPRPASRAKVKDSNPRQHFLNRIVVARGFEEQMVRIARSGANLQPAVADLENVGSSHRPVRTQGRAVEVILKAVDPGPDFGRCVGFDSQGQRQ